MLAHIAADRAGLEIPVQNGNGGAPVLAKPEEHQAVVS
jgi:hypothetical protein